MSESFNFDQWKRTSIRTVRVFSCLCIRLTGSYFANAIDGAWPSGTEFGTQVAYFRGRGDAKGRASFLRAEVAEILRELRASGVDWRVVRNYRERLLSAPFSRGGVLEAQIRMNVACELLLRIQRCRKCGGKLLHDDDGPLVCRFCNQCVGVGSGAAMKAE